MLDLNTRQALYRDGFRNGQTDRRMSLRSDYSFYSIDSLNPHVQAYSSGYRDGWLRTLDTTRT